MLANEGRECDEDPDALPQGADTDNHTSLTHLFGSQQSRLQGNRPTLVA